MSEPSLEAGTGKKKRSVMIRAGDSAALAIVFFILCGGFLSHGYADEGWLRTIARIECGALACWSAIGFALGRWTGPRMASARLMLLLMLAAGVLSLLQLVPMKAETILGISPVWRGISESFSKSGIETPAYLTLAVAPEKAWLSLQHLVTALFFFSGVVILANHRSTAIGLITLVTGVSMLEGFFGLFNFLVAEAFRASGSVFNPNHYAVIVVIGLPLYFAALMEWKHHSDIMGEDLLGGRNPLLIFAGLGVVAGLGWMTALSRSSVIVTTVVMGVWAMVEAAHWAVRDREETRRSVTTVLAGCVIALLTLFVASLFFQGVLDRLFTGDPMSGNSRVKIWKACLEGLRESHYLGVGLGGSEFSINRFADYPLTTVPIWAHSDYVQWLCDMGVPACVVLLLVVVFLAHAFFRMLAYRAERYSWGQRRLHRAAMAGVAIALLHAFLDFHLRIPQIGFMVLTLVALVLQPGIFKVLQKKRS